MSKHFLTCSALVLFLIMPAVSSASSDKEDDVNRAQRAATVLRDHERARQYSSGCVE